MQHFMIAHLQDGHYGGTQILRPETAQMMHTRQFSNLPDMNGMCLGFYEETQERTSELSGMLAIPSTSTATCTSSWMPAIGFFISYNSAGKRRNSCSRNGVACFSGPLLPVRSPGHAGSANRGSGCPAGFWQVPDQPPLGNDHSEGLERPGRDKSIVRF